MRGKTMTRAIKIENLPPLDDTSVQILRIIALKQGENDSVYVSYATIAKSLNIARGAVSSSVKRMIARGVLKAENGKLSIQNTVRLN